MPKHNNPTQQKGIELNRSIISKVVVVLLLLAVMGASSTWTTQAQDKINVVASFHVTYVFANEIGGNLINLDVAAGPGIDAHDFEPSVTDLEKIAAADVFIWNGAGFEDHWVESLFENGTLDPTRQTIIETSHLIAQSGGLIAEEEEDHDGEDHEDEDEEHEDEHGHAHGGINPHIWLDPILALEIARAIEAGLASADPSNAATYYANGAVFRGDIGVLDLEIQAALQACDQEIIVQSHHFIDYFAKRYGFQTADTGYLEAVAPSVGELEELIDVVRDNNINYIFSETFNDAEETGFVLLSEVTGAEILFLEIFEGFESDILDIENYVEVMQENLEQLQIGLECI